jgi:riboflavin-specific deaminase-like protein
MGGEAERDAKGVQAPATLRRLLPAGDPATAQEIADQLELAAAARTLSKRPYAIVNMISTVDGRASIDGRSGSLGNQADRELFRALRTVVDAVVVGAGTVRAERYGRMIPDARSRRMRRERGLSEEPLACIVSAQLAVAPELPLLACAEARVVIVTSSQASLPHSAAHVEYVRAERDGLLDLAAAMAVLRERFAVRTLLCEGGPHLNSSLLAAGLVDELFLSLAPILAGADSASGEALRILAGPAADPPVELGLLAVVENDSHLFLRYGVGASAAGRVSRETTSSSSVAR